MLKKTLMSAVCCAAMAGAVSAAGTAGIPEVQTLQIGQFSVTVIEDRPTVFGRKLFEGIEKEPQRLALLPAEGAPGVVKTFLIRNGKHLILIDSGFGPAAGGKTADILAKLNVKAEDVTDILLTHLDGDHIGGMIKDGAAVFPNAVIRLSEVEYDAWIVKGIGRAEKSIEKARATFEKYPGKIKTFAFGEEVLPGIKAVDARGHTMGHTRFDIDSDGKAMTIVGDLMHAYPLQMRFTDMSSGYDADPLKAAQMREATLSELSATERFVSGMHVSPMGKVVKKPEGGYDFISIKAE